MELTNKELDRKFSCSCSDLRNELHEVSLKIGKILSRLDKLESSLLEKENKSLNNR